MVTVITQCTPEKGIFLSDIQYLFTIQVSSIHASLSLAVANEVLSCPEAPGVRIMCKILPMMDLSGCAQSTVKEMKILTARMIEVLWGL